MMGSVVLVALLSVLSLSFAATPCEWNCTSIASASFIAGTEVCWTCGVIPGATHDVTTTDGATITAALTLNSFTVTGGYVSISNAVFSVGALKLTDCTTVITSATIKNPLLDGSQAPLTIERGSFAATGFTMNSLEIVADGDLSFIGNTTFTNVLFTSNNNALFVGDASSTFSYVADFVFYNYGNLQVSTAAVPRYTFAGAATSTLYNYGNMTIGQGNVYGEVDMVLTLWLITGSNLYIPENRLLLPMWFRSNGGRIVMDGILRFENPQRLYVSTATFANTAPGVLAVYEGGAVNVNSNMNLPLAILQVSGAGSGLGFIVASTSTVTTATVVFNRIALTSGGEIGNHFADMANNKPIHAVVYCDTMSVVDGGFDMMENYGLDLFANMTLLQNKVKLGDHTIVRIPQGIVVVGATIQGDKNTTDGFVFGPQTTVRIFDAGYDWNHTVITAQNKVEFYLPEQFSPASVFVDASQSVVNLAGSSVQVFQNIAPLAWGDYYLIQSPSLTGPASSTITGSYSCLGGSVSATSAGLIFSQPAPTSTPPASLRASASQDSVVVRWDAPVASALPCFHNVSGYNVKVGTETYHVIQQALVLDLQLFATCEVVQAQVQAILTTTFTPALTSTSGFSTQDSFTRIPAPTVPVPASTVKIAGATASVTVNFGVSPTSACSCSSFLTGASYQIKYLDQIVTATTQNITLTKIPADYDIDFVYITVCNYSVSPASVQSSSITARVSTKKDSQPSNDTTTIIEKNKLSNGQAAGIAIGIVAAVAFGALLGLLVAKRAYVKLGSGKSVI